MRPIFYCLLCPLCLCHNAIPRSTQTTVHALDASAYLLPSTINCTAHRTFGRSNLLFPGSKNSRMSLSNCMSSRLNTMCNASLSSPQPFFGALHTPMSHILRMPYPVSNCLLSPLCLHLYRMHLFLATGNRSFGSVSYTSSASAHRVVCSGQLYLCIMSSVACCTRRKIFTCSAILPDSILCPV